jgi:hypothetical protein
MPWRQAIRRDGGLRVRIYALKRRIVSGRLPERQRHMRGRFVQQGVGERQAEEEKGKR